MCNRFNHLFNQNLFKTQQIIIKQRDLFKMTTICIDAGLRSLREVVHDLDQCFQANFIPRFLQRHVSTIRHSDRVFGALFLLECSTLNNRAGSSPGCSEAYMHKREGTSGSEEGWMNEFLGGYIYFRLFSCKISIIFLNFHHFS